MILSVCLSVLVFWGSHRDSPLVPPPVTAAIHPTAPNRSPIPTHPGHCLSVRPLASRLNTSLKGNFTFLKSVASLSPLSTQIHVPFSATPALCSSVELKYKFCVCVCVSVHICACMCVKINLDLEKKAMLAPLSRGGCREINVHTSYLVSLLIIFLAILGRQGAVL